MSPTRHAIEGKWQMIRAEQSGENAPELVARRTEVEFMDGVYIVRFDGQIADRGSYELTESADKDAMTLKGESGPNAGRTIPCIYQLVGDRLRVCYGLDSVLPAVFTTAVGQSQYSATYRRIVRSS